MRPITPLVISLLLASSPLALAQDRSEPGESPPLVRMPPLEVTAGRLPGTPLPTSSVPAAVEVAR